MQVSYRVMERRSTRARNEKSKAQRTANMAKRKWRLFSRFAISAQHILLELIRELKEVDHTAWQFGFAFRKTSSAKEWLRETTAQSEFIPTIEYLFAVCFHVLSTKSILSPCRVMKTLLGP